MKVKNIMFSGFAAAILMGAVDANAAFSIASKDYVDGKISTVTTNSTAAVDALAAKVGGNYDSTNTVAKAIADEATARAAADTALGDRVTANENIIKSENETIPSTIGTSTNVSTIVGAINALKTKTDSMATTDTMTQATTDIANLQTNKQNKSDSTVADAAAGTYTAITAGNGVGANLVALDGKLKTAEGNIGTLQSAVDGLTTGDGSVASQIAANSAADQAYTDTKVAAEETRAKGVESGLQTAIDTINDGAVMNSGITAEKRTAYDAVVNNMNQACTSESDYCALVKGPNNTIQWVEITDPFQPTTPGQESGN